MKSVKNCFFPFLKCCLITNPLEQKDAFEKKMEEKKRERALAEQKKNASVRAGRNAFKDKLEANAPPP